MLVTYDVKMVEGATNDVKNLYRDDDRVLVALPRGSTGSRFFENFETGKVIINYKKGGEGISSIVHKGKKIYPIQDSI